MDDKKYTYAELQDKYVDLLSPAVEITIGSKTYTNRDIPILSLEVEMSTDGSAGGCTFSVDSEYKSEGTPWDHDFDKSIKIGEKLIIKGGYVKQKELFYGYIDDYTFSYSGNEGQHIQITGIDGLGYLMHLREPLYGGQQQPQELIRSILQKSVAKGFAKSVTVGSLDTFKTPIVKEQMDDWSFLNLLASRYGVSLFAIDGELIFDDVYQNTKSLITLRNRTNLRRFSRRISLAHQVGSVEIWGRDVNQKPIKGIASSVSMGGSGKSAAQLVSALKDAVMREYSEYVRTPQECEKLAQNRLNGIAMGFVSGEGACIGIPEIIPGRYIEIEGLDDEVDGSYFLSRVRHVFRPEGYSTEFEVKGAKSK